VGTSTSKEEVRDQTGPSLTAGLRYVFQGEGTAYTLTAIVISKKDGRPYLLLAGVVAQRHAALFIADRQETGARIGTVCERAAGPRFIGALAEPETGYLLRSTLSDNRISLALDAPDIGMQVYTYGGKKISVRFQEQSNKWRNPLL